MALRALARGSRDRAVIAGDSGRIEAPYGAAPVRVDEGGHEVNQQRILVHPGLAQEDGVGILYYDPPPLTRGFIRDVAIGTDTSVVRAVGSTILVERSMLESDGIVSEIWLGGENLASTFAEFFRQVWLFKQTPLDPGQFIGWSPLDLTTRGYRVRIAAITLGTPDVEYREVKERVRQLEDAVVTAQLTLTLKLEAEDPRALGSITLEGL